MVEIWLNTFGKWGETQADACLGELIGAMQALAEPPFISQESLEFTPPVLTHRHVHYLEIYLAWDGGINGIRVLHEKMEIDSHL